jgi:hypothetical protein
MAGTTPVLLPEVKPMDREIMDHEVRYTYDVVFKHREALAFRTVFDDLQKSTTILEFGILISAVIIAVLLVVVVQFIRITLKKSSGSNACRK